MGFVVNLHAWGFIFMEGAAQAHMFVRLKTIPAQYLGHRQPFFNLLYFHGYFLCADLIRDKFTINVPLGQLIFYQNGTNY